MATDMPIVNDSFAATVQRLKKSLPQGILLHGEQGIGLNTIAQYIAGKNPMTVVPLSKKGDVDPISGTISIERIRSLYEQTRSGGVSVVLIDNADRMSINAQNAFLKLLEEPSSKLHFILTSHHPDQLLPTIQSRVQAHHVPRISDQQSRSILAFSKLTAEQQTQALFLAAGRPALLLHYSNNPATLTSQAAVMNDARQFLSGTSRYERLKAALRYSSSRSEALKLIDATVQIMRHSLYHAPSEQNATTAARLLTLHDAIERNASPRLQLVQFVLE
ncbi:AAA family ATPase [Candidatus Saccharibacteria bacterium]|nr:AAA family ATPase [Candidatus Saccharibacteria bacterium]